MIVVIPMAGRGSRYSNFGYSTPKPLIKINEKPMLYYAFNSVRKIKYDKVVFIALKEHHEEYNLDKLIRNEIVFDFELILLDEITEGQLCTVLKAKDYFEKGKGILIAASDSYVESNIHLELDCKCDGLISVANLEGDNWSFARTDKENRVIEVSEKERISEYASTGIYYFSDAKVFEIEAERLISNNETTKNEYYVMPVYQKLINNNKLIKLSHAKSMWDMGTPDAKKRFENFLNNE
tara:strand:- start:538 stop:1251 length:714 start_codon:yes stop_codon:yes gene_type:complete